MRKQKIGPLALLSGLQLQTGEGRADGLLRAVNMEPLNGLLCTRRGMAPVAVVPSVAGTDGVYNSAVDATYAWFNFSGTAPPPGVDVLIEVASLSGAEIAQLTSMYFDYEEQIVFDYYGSDGQYHALEVHPYNESGTGTALLRLWFVVPHGLASDPVNGFGGVGTVRLTFGPTYLAGGGSPTLAGFAAVAGGTYQQCVPSTKIGLPVSGVEAVSRTGHGPYMLYEHPLGFALTEVNGPRTQVALGFLGVTSKTVNAVKNTLRSGVPHNGVMRAVYVQESDVILTSYEGGYTTTPADLSSNPADFAPELLEEFSDIDCRTVLPNQPRAMCVFAGRVFIGGPTDDPTLVIWGGAGEFWTAFPTVNTARLGDGDAGAILAMVPLDDQLFIFTTRSIWRAVLQDPTAGNESDLLVTLLEATGCESGESVRAANGSIIFLAADGLRALSTSKSKNITLPVLDMFRPDSQQPMACLRKDTAIGAWDPVENRFYLSYATPGAYINNAFLVVDLVRRTCWLWGQEPTGTSEAGPPGTGVLVDPSQESSGCRSRTLLWDSIRRRIVMLSPFGVLLDIAGEADWGFPARWHFESHNLRLGSTEQSVLERIDLTVRRDHFLPFSVAAVADGDRARTDSRSIAPEPDRLDTTVTTGGASLVGNITPLQTEESFVPVTWRGRKKARNHRVRIASTGAHARIACASMSVMLSVEDAAR